MITVEQAVKNLKIIQEMYLWNTGADESFNMAINCLLKNREKTGNKEEEEKEIWEEVTNYLESTAKELLEREDKNQHHAFAKGITFAVSMIKNYIMEAEE